MVKIMITTPARSRTAKPIMPRSRLLGNELIWVMALIYDGDVEGKFTDRPHFRGGVFSCHRIRVGKHQKRACFLVPIPGRIVSKPNMCGTGQNLPQIFAGGIVNMVTFRLRCGDRSGGIISEAFYHDIVAVDLAAVE